MHASSYVEELREDDRLVYEWARAERFWTPLSLIAVDAAGLADTVAREAVGRWLTGVCRRVDVVCRTGAARFCVILPSTNRTGAEAELARLLRASASLDARWGRVGFGLAVAFDGANTPLELKMLAEQDADVDRHRLPTAVAEAEERPTIPQLGSHTWIEPLQAVRSEALTIPHLPR